MAQLLKTSFIVCYLSFLNNIWLMQVFDIWIKYKNGTTWLKSLKEWAGFIVSTFFKKKSSLIRLRKFSKRQTKILSLGRFLTWKSDIFVCITRPTVADLQGDADIYSLFKKKLNHICHLSILVFLERSDTFWGVSMKNIFLF